MLVITKGEINNLIVTTTENVTINNPYYLWVFRGLSGSAVIKVFLTDVSVYPERYNKFNFTEGDEITFVQKGDYEYSVYEKDTNSNQNIPDSAYLLERGIARVVSDQTNTDYIHTTTANNVIYEKY